MREHRAGSTADEHRVALVRRARQSSPASLACRKMAFDEDLERIIGGGD